MTFPSFTTGEVLTAADMNAVGLWLVKTQTIGTAVSTVTVTGAFSSNYDAYLITITGGVGSGSAGVNMTLGATATGYYFAANYVSYIGGSGVFNGANVASWQECIYMSTQAINCQITLKNPNLAQRTFINWQNSGAATTAVNLSTNGGGYLNDSTQYTAFTLTPTAGTMTGGTIRVYGYRN
jgi:hypothetical protein